MSALLTHNLAPRTILMTADTIGGVWTYAMELARGLVANGTSVILATMGDPMSTVQRQEAAAVRGLRVVESTFKLEWMDNPWEDIEAAGRWLLELEHRFAPDVVHLNGYVHGSLPWRAPVLVVGHSCVLTWWQAVKGEQAPSSWDEYRRRVAKGIRSASAVTAPTQSMLDALDEQYGPLPSSLVLHNGRCAIPFHANDTKQPFIFAAGRLGDEAKNVRALGEAAESLPWPVFVAGAEQDASGKLDLPLNVTPCGKLSPTAIADWMGLASIYCLPARYEPFGLSVLEAALSGCTLVLGDIPTLREIWNGCACFVPPNSPTEINRALHDLIANPARRSELSSAAQVRARQYSFEKFIDGYHSLYRHLLNSHQPRQILAA